jgi:hypothetical protein
MLNRRSTDRADFCPEDSDSLANICEKLGLGERQIAQRLGLSVAALRFYDRADAPPYLRLALAALVAGIDPDLVLRKCDADPLPH